MSQVERKAVPVEDVKVGKILWASFSTDFGEGHVEGPLKVESVHDDKVSLRFLGTPGNIAGQLQRYAVNTVSIATVTSGKRIFLPNPKEFEEHMARERKWIESERKFLDECSSHLDSAEL